jgi:hypothetical protein
MSIHLIVIINADKKMTPSFRPFRRKVSAQELAHRFFYKSVAVKKTVRDIFPE